VIHLIAMPKVKTSNSCHLKQTVVEFGDDKFSTDDDNLYSKMCDTKVAAENRFTVQHHIRRYKHLQAVQVRTKRNLCKCYCNNVHLKVEISYRIFSEICVIL
jgi:hypothetical protein